jgi:SmpA / OmlA family
MRVAGVPVVFALLALVMLGCFTVGRNFASAPVTQIEKGVTTKTEIKQWFGDQFRTGLDDGYESWTYIYSSWTGFSQTNSKDLYIIFNKDGTVRSYAYNSNGLD